MTFQTAIVCFLLLSIQMTSKRERFCIYSGFNLHFNQGFSGLLHEPLFEYHVKIFTSRKHPLAIFQRKSLLFAYVIKGIILM